MSRWSGVSLTCPQQVVRVGLVEFGEQHDKRAAPPQQTAESWQANILTSYEETASVEFTLYTPLPYWVERNII